MVILRKIGVIKSACFLGIFGLFMGVIADLILLIFSAVMSSIFPSFGGSSDGIGTLTSTITGGFTGLGLGVLSYILIPLIYGIISFLSGLIFTPLMNLILKMIHGLDLDIVE